MVVDLITRLKNDGDEVDLFIFDGTPSPLRREAEEAGIKVFVSGKGYWQMWSPHHIFNIRKILKKGKYDIINTHNTPAQVFTAIANGRKRWGRMVTTEHNTTNRRREWKWYKRFDDWMYGKYDHIVCVGDKTRCNLEERIGCHPDKISVIANGIDLSRFSYPDVSCRENNPSQKVVLMVSAFRLQKDHATLIKAMTYLPENYMLWLAGDGIMMGKTQDFVKSLRLENRVIFLGARDDVPQLFQKADVVVLASHYEGMPISAIEAMGSGKPFVASDVEGLRELVSGAGVLVPESDSAALASEIKKICENPDVAASIAEKCKERAALYDIDTTASKYYNLYRKLL